MPEQLNNARQLVVFYLASEEYGVAITQVQEVIRKMEITRIPGMPDFIEGVINLRGKIIPVIDLRRRFKLPSQADTDKTRIIVIKSGEQVIGLIVDGVSEVVYIPSDQIDPIPPTIAAIDADYLSGVGKLEKRLVILLNLEKLIDDLERISLDQLNKKDKQQDNNAVNTNTADENKK